MFLEVPRAQVRLQTHRVHVSRLVLGDLVAFTLVWVSVIAKLANWRYGVTQHLSEQTLCLYVFKLFAGNKRIFVSTRFTSTTRSFCTVQILVEEKVASFVVFSHCVTHKLRSEELLGEKHRFL